MLLLSINLYGQTGTVEAELEEDFKYEFKSLKKEHDKTVLIDSIHNTIYSKPYGKETAREMLRIIKADGFNIKFSGDKLLEKQLNTESTDLLVIHGIPNNKLILNNENSNETLYTSPLTTDEIVNIGKFVYNGGGLFLFLSHFPEGSGALPLLEAFEIKFRDGYAFHSQYHTSEDGLCGHFMMNQQNEMLNTEHQIFSNTIDKNTIPENIRFYCGAAVFRNPEDVILPFPKNTINYTPKTNYQPNSGEIKYIEESSNNYAGMIGFEYGEGRIVVCTDQGIFRSMNLIIKDKKIPVTIHDPEADNAGLFLNILRWLTKLQ
ncbi:hypothetical protein GCM10011444_10310 [Winogradskyella haliclonae]|uniref:Uncharacterized protein n=2 Tax=Winogradskyella haliclonae TaxID=2048558 RepID=A0ABQ2BY46_9FLAO|nr:hypothetical protein GCM10011444_10310 [Winogradskyella haliclonae]